MYSVWHESYLTERNLTREEDKEGLKLDLAGPSGMVDNMIFVFGSNDAGIHGAGAARIANLHRGFPRGIGEGLSARCYALPTKDVNIKSHSFAVIRRNVNNFLHLAGEMYDLECAFSSDDRVPMYGHTRFQVTRVGCGLAGFKDINIACLFLDAPPNCWFDSKWSDELGPEYNYWGTY